MKVSTSYQQLKQYLPENVAGHISARYDQIDSLLKPYNLPLETYYIVGIAFTVLIIILISSCSGGGNKSNRRGGVSTKKVKRGNNIIILGLSNSGKTALFLDLTLEKEIATHTSISPNNGVYQVNSKKLPIIDVPGNEKIKASLPKILQNAGCIIYTIDVTEFIDNATQEAQYLYDILTNESVFSKRIPIMIFINKMDIGSSIDVAEVTSILEKELDDLRKTRGASPTVLGQEDDKKDIYLGNEGSSFQFDQIPNEVTFSKGSATQNECEDIKNFISLSI
ncbi:hypothetical protein DICPUDRAFT_147655 [Dictyostelium purpureum]|uniref:Signal recognition particle receptor subunit beta n=1 Tax=Dictyostelium purpureum TaxID=5786 RepID=F0Z922_DICPU|nr:uncharacterized protein DICPUDRAFT_147655 [Dictyostelium purpureum]EGC39588.1 hypothetical protein DICPUDRAFT_147655 [Dictyostelium purpureum]|eukprot:XP_003283923.1 hypothetical protein DICPUDRAFT_147655 [Dictyostelium purpureum]